MSEKIKLKCTACHTVFWADAAGLPDGSTEGSLVPYPCPQCDNEESKVEK